MPLEIPLEARLEKNGNTNTAITELFRYNWPRILSLSAQALITAAMLRGMCSVPREADGYRYTVVPPVARRKASAIGVRSERANCFGVRPVIWRTTRDMCA